MLDEFFLISSQGALTFLHHHKENLWMEALSPPLDTHRIQEITVLVFFPLVVDFFLVISLISFIAMNFINQPSSKFTIPSSGLPSIQKFQVDFARYYDNMIGPNEWDLFIVSSALVRLEPTTSTIHKVRPPNCRTSAHAIAPGD
jgi:hypothetical protein